VPRAHKSVATIADHVWIARNRGKFILITRVDWTQPVLFGWSGNDAGLQSKKGRTMLKKLLGAAAMAAAAYAFVVPAHARHVHHAAHVGVGCSGDNFAKAEGGVETMADGPAKFMAEREIAQAQDAMLGGQMSGCAMHLSRALDAENVAHAPYPETMAPAPLATTQEAQPPQWNWTPLKGAY